MIFEITDVCVPSVVRAWPTFLLSANQQTPFMCPQNPAKNCFIFEAFEKQLRILVMNMRIIPKSSEIMLILE